MELVSDFRIVFELLRRRGNNGSHVEKLNDFYKNQAVHYDSFRERLLYGRNELLDSVIPENFSGIWVDIGGGTGRNVEYVSNKLNPSAKVYIVDICRPLLDIAQKRITKNCWDNVHLIEHDAREFSLPCNALPDIITFSYSLSMIPDSFRAIMHAYQLLEQGGKIGIVDFYRPDPGEHKSFKSWWYRWFVPIWFSSDSVILDTIHHRYPRSLLNEELFNISSATLPYLPMFYYQYFRFLGVKK